MKLVPRALGAWLFLALLSPTATQATSVILLSETDLIDRANLIVSGTVLSSESAFRAGPMGVFTDVSLEVQEVLKGTYTDEVLHVGMPGGELDGRRVAFAGVPAFKPGESVVVFLIALQKGGYTTVGISQGKYLLEVDPQTGLTMARQAGGDMAKFPLATTGQTARQALLSGAPRLTDWDVFRRRIRTRVKDGSNR